MNDMKVCLISVGKMMRHELIAGMASYGAAMCSISVDLDRDC
ncbi:hypothetical protein PMI22_01328 [Pseudomonas sp. GM21]|nr:hypothetical protein PMI22_01328 [Pseudomonas sp. GM21]